MAQQVKIALIEDARRHTTPSMQLQKENKRQAYFKTERVLKYITLKSQDKSIYNCKPLFNMYQRTAKYMYGKYNVYATNHKANVYISQWIPAEIRFYCINIHNRLTSFELFNKHGRCHLWQLSRNFTV